MIVFAQSMPPCDNPIDQPEVLTDHLHAFLAAHT